MPMPGVRKGQSQKDFIAAFMSNEAMKAEFPEQKQRLAVAYSRWRKKHGGEPPGEKRAVKAVAHKMRMMRGKD